MATSGDNKRKSLLQEFVDENGTSGLNRNYVKNALKNGGGFGATAGGIYTDDEGYGTDDERDLGAQDVPFDVFLLVELRGCELIGLFLLLNGTLLDDVTGRRGADLNFLSHRLQQSSHDI